LGILAYFEFAILILISDVVPKARKTSDKGEAVHNRTKGRRKHGTFTLLNWEAFSQPSPRNYQLLMFAQVERQHQVSEIIVSFFCAPLLSAFNFLRDEKVDIVHYLSKP
jgi:hypothetical protein